MEVVDKASYKIYKRSEQLRHKHSRQVIENADGADKAQIAKEPQKT